MRTGIVHSSTRYLIYLGPRFGCRYERYRSAPTPAYDDNQIQELDSLRDLPKNFVDAPRRMRA